MWYLRTQEKQQNMDTQRIFVAPPSPVSSPRPLAPTSPRLSPAGSGRSQPEGSSGSQTPTSSTQHSVRPLAPVGAAAPDRSQPEGSLRLHPVGSLFSSKDESGRSQPEGSCPGLLSPTSQYRPLPHATSSPRHSPAPSPRGSPQTSRSHPPKRPDRLQEPIIRPNSIHPPQDETDKSPFNEAIWWNEQNKAGDDFRVYVITWNVGCSVPPTDLTSLLCLNAGDGKTDMFVIGSARLGCKVAYCWCLPSIFTCPFCVMSRLTALELALEGNKGGVSIRLSLFGHMVCFLNCHLPAHMENSDQRVDNFESILQLQQFQGPLANGVLDHDLVFWFGDLNFRIDDLDLHFVKSAIQGNKLSLLWEKDQLNMAKCYEPVLSGFMEGPLTFPPTYKYDVGTNTYDTSSKKRKPAWTDRILWKMKNLHSQNASGKADMSSSMSEELSMTLLSYGCHMHYTESDHKPVSAIFSLKVHFVLQDLLNYGWLPCKSV
ncbi:hypothetical protein AB205_0031990 [Aquarana catesbeiana]|uniref:phosphoinositide 5-phosphatase n=1 Tax=Aquarana catesbeiana TaxID=8400 RepID=A0A2G9RT73_AQUCT|nr:hypothetical protein AB205_0031990 [Aquarana catesbeiana]